MAHRHPFRYRRSQAPAQLALGLTWDAVDWEGAVLRLSAQQTKGKRGRVFPFGLAPDLKTLLDTQWEQRSGPFVFHREGEPLAYQTLRVRWKKACERAWIDRIIHDLRRTAARDMRRAGVSEGEVMALCGWRTRAMFDRYNIIDEQDLARAVAKRFAEPNGKQAASNEGTASPSRPLSSSAV